MKTTGLLLLLVSGVNAITKGINFFGFETETKAVHMLWCQPLEWHINKIADLGFNSIRLPVSEDFIMADWDTQYPGNGVVNPQFPQYNMKSIEIMDQLFDLTARRNISIIMDIHRLYNTQQAPKPFIENTIYTFVRFMDAWVKIITRYVNRPNFIGIDVFNEYQSNDWNDWKNLAQITINHIESTFPKRLNYYVEGARWGGDLSGAKNNPLIFNDQNLDSRVFYSVHKYWFSDSNIVYDEPALINSWDYSFGFLNNKVMVGEWGYISEDSMQVQWGEKFVKYLKNKGIRDTYFWSYNPDSGDTKGVLMDDCVNVNEQKMELLRKLWS